MVKLTKHGTQYAKAEGNPAPLRIENFPDLSPAAWKSLPNGAEFAGKIVSAKSPYGSNKPDLAQSVVRVTDKKFIRARK